MATSTCVKCGNRSFEVKLASPVGAEYKVYYLQCVSCGGVAAGFEYYMVGEMVRGLQADVKKLRTEVSNVQRAVDGVSADLRKLRR